MFSVEAVLHPYLTTGQKEALGYPADEIKRSWSEIRKPEHSCVRPAHWCVSQIEVVTIAGGLIPPKLMSTRDCIH